MSEDMNSDTLVDLIDLSLDISSSLRNIRQQIIDREVVREYFEGIQNALSYLRPENVGKTLPIDSPLRKNILEFQDSLHILIRNFVDEINISFGIRSELDVLMEVAQLSSEEEESTDPELNVNVTLVQTDQTTVTQVTQVTEQILTVDDIDMDLFGAADGPGYDSSEEVETVTFGVEQPPVEEEEISSGSEFNTALREQFIFVPEAFLGKSQKTSGTFAPTTADVNHLIIALMNLDGKRLPKQLGRALKAVYGDELDSVVLKVRDISINNTLELSNLQHRRKLLDILQNELLRHQAYILSEDATAKPQFQEANDALRQYDPEVLRETLLAWGMFQLQ